MASTATSAILAPRNICRVYPMASRSRNKAVSDERVPVGPVFIEQFRRLRRLCAAPREIAIVRLMAVTNHPRDDDDQQKRDPEDQHP